jgi:DNA-binding PadR family transcriptional regulator
VKKKKVDLLQGMLDLLVLKALALEPLHGLGVSRRIERITKGTFQLIKVGQCQLEVEFESWQRIVLAMTSALQTT